MATKRQFQAPNVIEATKTVIKPVRSTQVKTGFQQSRRYRDLCDLAETMHTFAKQSSHGTVKASTLQMFAHQLLIILHRAYRENK